MWDVAGNGALPEGAAMARLGEGAGVVPVGPGLWQGEVRVGDRNKGVLSAQSWSPAGPGLWQGEGAVPGSRSGLVTGTKGCCQPGAGHCHSPALSPGAVLEAR